MKFVLCWRALALVLASLAPFPVFAGDPGGPRVVWVNAGDGPNAAFFDRELVANITSGNLACWSDNSSYIYMRRRPKGITTQLVIQALVKNNDVALQKLNSILGNYQDSKTTGLDGVMLLYGESNAHLKIFGLTQGTTVPSVSAVKLPVEAASVAKSFCDALPAVVRKP